MPDLFDPISLFFLAIAVFFILRLRSTLGSRTGNERPPGEPRISHEEQGTGSDNVITLPGSEASQPYQPWEEDTQEEQDKLYFGEDEVVRANQQAVMELRAVDPTFQTQEFLHGASSAYEMIVVGFAQGDRQLLGNLLGEGVLEDFLAAIDQREARGEQLETTFVGLDSARIADVSLQGYEVQISVRFATRLVSCTRDAENRVIEGDPNSINDGLDLWTFARDTRSNDPNWKLIATEPTG